MGQNAVLKLSAWHAAIVDWEFEFPEKSNKDCAEHFGVTEAWMSRLRNSDLFIEYRETRRLDHNDKISETIIDKTTKVAGLALDVMAERIDQDRADISLSTLREAGEMTLKALGFGAANPNINQPGTVNNTVNIGVASQGALADAREQMARLRGPKVIEHEETSPEALPAPG